MATEQALQIRLVGELTPVDDVTPRAHAWLAALLALPRQPMLQTRAMARADLIAALLPEKIRPEHFIDGWFSPDTQAGLQALLAKLRK